MRHVAAAHSACDHAIAKSERGQHECAGTIAISLLTSSSSVAHDCSIDLNVVLNVISAGSLGATAHTAQLVNGHGHDTLPLRSADEPMRAGTRIRRHALQMSGARPSNALHEREQQQHLRTSVR